MKINERFRLNGEPVDDETFLRVFGIVKDKIDEMSEAGFAHPSYFEFLFGMASRHSFYIGIPDVPGLSGADVSGAEGRAGDGKFF